MARKWGNSIAVIIPKGIAEKENIKENAELTIEIKKKSAAGILFGKFSNWKKSSQQIKEEMRSGW